MADTAAPTDRPAAWRMPAEWAPHERCVVAWPTRDDLWGGHAAEARREYAAIVAAVSRFEPVLVVAVPGRASEVRACCGPGVEVVELPIDDSWVRDSGPIFVVDNDGHRAGVDFRFNAWGNKLPDYAEDDRLPARLLARLGLPRLVSDMVLEGGSISVDGEGTLLATEQCLLHPNRNPNLTRAQIEDELRLRLGVESVVWLPHGSAPDSMTDGHVDGVCVFARPGVVLLQSDAPGSPYAERYAANRRALEAARDARGRRLEIVEAPRLAFADVDGKRVRVPLVNVYLANGGVVAPVSPDEPADDWLRTLRAVFPERAIVPVPVRILPWSGGAIHCVTQQLPKGA